MAKKIVIGSDHGGFALKEEIKKSFKKGKWAIKDVGPETSEPCDYPRYGYAAAKEVSEGRWKKGIVICKSGIGMSIIANKLPGVRAALCLTEKDAIGSRQHNDANMLVLAADRSSVNAHIKIVKTWLNTKSLKGRHARRVKQIKEIEKKVFKKRRK
ncbi:MAG: ribose 5-phosphate isomerase B [Candidatus Omnitrophota bacterium]|nr:ribose 5-phosphate isomerase B [Candidatus Omnitrophota bacterium]